MARRRRLKDVGGTVHVKSRRVRASIDGNAGIYSVCRMLLPDGQVIIRGALGAGEAEEKAQTEAEVALGLVARMSGRGEG